MTKQNLVNWRAPAGAIHSLPHLATLSPDRDVLLCISDRSYYVLLNLVALDAQFAARYARELNQYGFWPIREGDPDYQLYLDVVENLEVEVQDMSCDVVSALNEIRDAINDAAILAAQSAMLCCSELGAPGTYWDEEPEEGEPASLCDLAYSYALAWKKASDEAYAQWARGGFPAAEVLQTIFDAFDLPGQVLLSFATYGASQVLPILEGGWSLTTGDLLDDIVCAIWGSPGSSAARAAIYAVIEGRTENEVARELLKAPLSYNSLNRVYSGAWVPVVESPIDCEEYCEALCGETGWRVGSGDLTPDGQPRVWTSGRDANGDHYIDPKYGYNVSFKCTALIGWMGDYPGFPDFRTEPWLPDCSNGEMTEVDPLSAIIGQTYVGRLFTSIMWRDWPEHFQMVVEVSEIA